MKFIRLKFIFLAMVSIVLGQSCFAGVEIGAGMNSFTAGRAVPSIEIGISAGDSLFTWVGSGVRNAYYYQAAHQVSYFKTWSAGTLWGGDMSSGFGLAAAYSVRSFVDEGSTSEEISNDYILGPAFRMNWSFGHVFLNMSATFGLRDIWQHVTGLTFQDIETVSIGVRF